MRQQNLASTQLQFGTTEHSSAFVGLMLELINDSRSHDGHADLKESRIEKDKETLCTVTSLIAKWVNPCSDNKKNYNISSAREVPGDILRDHDIGNENVAAFRRDSL